jgi:serine/threonine protein kinase
VYRGYHSVRRLWLGLIARLLLRFMQETGQAVAIKALSRSILTTKTLDHIESEINILRSLRSRHITELTDVIVSFHLLSSRGLFNCTWL